MKKIFKVAMAACVMVSIFPLKSLLAEGSKIAIKADQLSGYSDPSYPLSNAVDGDTSTYWKSIPTNGYGETDDQKKETKMYDHNRYITIELDGVYDLDKIKIYNVDGSFNNYYVYASEDGEKFDKIVSKTDNALSKPEGDVFSVRKRASYIRLNMAYNANAFETNLAEIEVYGSKVTDEVTKPKPIKVDAWQGSTYQKEWDKFETDQSYADKKVINEVKSLAKRVIGQEWASKFRFELRDDLNGNDVFELENGNGSIIVRGNDGVSLASGFNYYLKNYANVDYNPLFESNVDMKKLVMLDKKVVKETQYDVRYALNFCTYSYSMAFWGWDEYQAFIDWAAMNGVNLMLDIVGQEEVIRQTLKQYNYSDEEIKEYIAGPGYFAWFYMQNLYSTGGPLPDDWFEQRVELGRKMHDRMQAFGIDPVIQGFSGQVPLSFDDKNEGSVLTPIDGWVSYTRPAIIKTYLSDEEIAAGKKDYFKDMSTAFYEAQKNVFGDVSNYYAADPFHEGGNITGLDITNIFKTVQTEMLRSNEDAIWVLQQWQGNLGNANLSGLVKPEQALALDLQTDKNPSYGVMENHKVPWIWNMLHNFGGRMGLDGEIDSIASKPAETFVKEDAPHMVGIGITPEALENSPIVYELLFDMTWSKDPIDPAAWVEQYAKRRANGTSDSLQEAWDILHDTAYSVKKEYFQGAAESVVNARPGMGFSSASTWGHSLIPYDKTELDKALQLLIDNYDAFSSSPAYRYDLADVADQVLNNAAIEYHGLMVNAYNTGNSAEFKRVSQHFLELIELSDKIQGATKEFMVGTWIDDARNMLDDADDWTKDLFEYNARALITTWGTARNNSLKDYSNRKWSGLTSTFYKERWSMWISNRQADLDKTAKDPVAQKAESNWFLWEWQWVNRKSDDGFAFPTKENYANLKDDAQLAFDKYSTTSIKDFGGKVDSDVNIAEGKLFVSDPATSEALRKNLSDNNTATEWKVNDDASYAFTLDLEGTYKISSVEILLQQLAKDFSYNYKVEIYDPNKNAWQEIEANAENDTMTSQTVIALDKESNQEASQIRITMKTRDAASMPLTIAELKVMGKAIDVQTVYNIAKGLSATCDRPTASDANISYITDDNLNNLWKSVWGSTTSMYPATVSLDLKTVYDVTNVEVYFEKIGLPYKFKVIAIYSDNSEMVILDKTDTTDVLSDQTYKIPVNASIRGVKVVYEGTTGKGTAGAASPALRELKVLSLSPQKEEQKSVNFALNKPVAASSTNPVSKAIYANDGDKDSVWVFNGYTEQTANLEIDLQASNFIENVELLFKKEDYNKYYVFDVYVKDAAGNKEVILSESDENIANKLSYKIPVNKKISKVGVDFKGKKAGTNGWFDIAELGAYGPKATSTEIVFGSGNIEGTSTKDEYKNALDGNLDTFVGSIKDKEMEFVLDNEYYVDQATFTFEKAELGLRYMVYSEDKEGTRSVLLDASSTNDVLSSRDVVVNVNRVASKIIFKHLGNNGNGPAYLAEARLYEASFTMGTPKSILKDATIDKADAGALHDDNKDTSYTMALDSSVEFTLQKSVDINMLHMIIGTTKTRSSQSFSVEAYDSEKQEWIVIYDGSKNTTVLPEYIIALKESVFTNKLRLTSNCDGLVVAEFKAYEADMTQPLIAYMKQVRTIIDEKRYDDNNGSYKLEEKAKVEEALTNAQTKLEAGMSSKDVQKEMATIKSAVNNFLKNGVIYIDRTPLLSNINYGTLVLQTATTKQRSIEENLSNLESKLTEARALYEQYDVTQTAISTCNTELEAAIAAVYKDLNVEDRFEVEKARAQLLSETVAGDKHGQAAQADIDTIKSALATAITDFASDTAEKLTVIRTLAQASTEFEGKLIVVSKVDLLAILSEVDGLQKGSYDFDTWNVFETAFAEANRINETITVSQAEVDNAIQALKDGKKGLKLLDRNNLSTILDQVSTLDQALYTEESWAALQTVYEEATTLYASDEVTQKQLDDMHKKVKDALDALVLKPQHPDEPENPDTPENPENPGNPDTPSNPDQPQQPNKPGDTQEGNKTPTGDESQSFTTLYVVLLGGSLLITAFMWFKKREDRIEEQ